MHKSRLCLFPGDFALQGKKGLNSVFESKTNICKRGRMIHFKSHPSVRPSPPFFVVVVVVERISLKQRKKPQMPYLTVLGAARGTFVLQSEYGASSKAAQRRMKEG